MRWLIQWQPIREPRFGETAREVYGWRVQAYLTLADGSRQMIQLPATFRGLSQAYAHATRESRRWVDAAASAIARDPNPTARPAVVS